MSDLIELVRGASGAAKLWGHQVEAIIIGEAADQLEAQQAEIAEYKKQIKQMGSSVQHYEHLAMKFSSQADVYSHDRQRARAEIARLRELLGKVFSELDTTQSPGHHHSVVGVWDDYNGDLSGKPCEWCATWSEVRQELEQKP